MAKPSTHVYPVEGRSINHFPAAPLITTQEIAARLIRTGAFTDSKERGAELPDPIELEVNEDRERSLDFYDPPEPPASEPEGPADAGSSDATPEA